MGPHHLQVAALLEAMRAQAVHQPSVAHLEALFGREEDDADAEGSLRGGCVGLAARDAPIAIRNQEHGRRQRDEAEPEREPPQRGPHRRGAQSDRVWRVPSTW